MKRRAASTSASPILDIYSVVAVPDPHAIKLFTCVTHNMSDKIVETESLLDSGAGGVFMDQNFAKNLCLDIKTLDNLVLA